MTGELRLKRMRVIGAITQLSGAKDSSSKKIDALKEAIVVAKDEITRLQALKDGEDGSRT